MLFHLRSAILLTFCLTLIAGCEKRRPDLPPGEPLLRQATGVHTVEMPQEALPRWRTDARQKPVLLLLSADSLLQPIPEGLRSSARSLATGGTPQDLRAHGPLRAETWLMPGQALSAALDAGLFSKVIWVLPQKNPDERIDLDATRRNLFEAGAIDDYEADGLKPTDTGFKGEIRGIPFEAVLSSGLAELELDTPAILHLDLTFFASLYLNEIKTPIFPLIATTLTGLRTSELKVLAVTQSLDSLIGQTPLDLRFVGKLIEEFFADPGLLDNPAPRRWELRAKALYLDTFFQPEKVTEIYRQMLAYNPNDPSVRFALYRAYKQNKQPDEARASLSRAVAGDPAYGLEYMLLAADAYRRGDLVAAVDLYREAADALPDDLRIKVNLAKALADASRHEEARGLVAELQGLNWSEPYYPDMKAFLESLNPDD